VALVAVGDILPLAFAHFASAGLPSHKLLRGMEVGGSGSPQNTQGVADSIFAALGEAGDGRGKFLGFVFKSTAKSEFHIRDEEGRLLPEFASHPGQERGALVAARRNSTYLHHCHVVCGP
jgi:hypothetical protein